MAQYPPRPFNRGGIWAIKSVGTPQITADSVTFKFESHPYVRAPYNGELIVRIDTSLPDGIEQTLPVYFQTGNEPRKAVSKVGDVPLTAGDILNKGYYKFFYDFAEGVLEAFASII